MDARQSRIRHLAKTVTWRLVGTVDTILLGWLVSGDATVGLTIGGTGNGDQNDFVLPPRAGLVPVRTPGTGGLHGRRTDERQLTT